MTTLAEAIQESKSRTQSIRDGAVSRMARAKEFIEEQQSILHLCDEIDMLLLGLEIEADTKKGKKS
jgi:hypothetical protein